MKLRVYRTWSWWPDTPAELMKMGGKSSAKLVAKDELQYFCHGQWYPVDVVEQPKPERPAWAE